MLPDSLSPIWPELVAALPATWQAAALVGVRPAGGTTPQVWKLIFDGAPPLAAKLAAPGAPLDVEAQALRWLHQHACRVPPVLAQSAAKPCSWLLLGWCGDVPLDDAAQHAPADTLATLGRQVAQAIAQIDTAFRPLTQRARANAEAWESAGQALRAQMAPWFAAAGDALSWLMERPLTSLAARLLADVERVAVTGPLHLGSLDYNPRNVVLDRLDDRPPVVSETGPLVVTVLDFASVGPHWPEHRLVQYATATGAATGIATKTAAGTDIETRTDSGTDIEARTDSGTRTDQSDSRGFISVLDASVVETYAEAVAPWHEREGTAIVEAVDAHEVLLLTMAARHLRAISEGQAHPERAASWGNVAARQAQLRRLLARPLAQTGPAAALRNVLASRAVV